MIINTRPLTLQTRMLTIAGERRRLRLAQGTWAALDQIADREEMTVGEIVTCVHERVRGRRLAQNLEVFVVAYFQAATPSRQRVNSMPLM